MSNPSLRNFGIGQVSLTQDLDTRLLQTKLGDHGVRTRVGHASIQYFDDDVLGRKSLGQRTPRLRHVARVPLDRHYFAV